MTPGMRCALYLRVSNDRLTVDNQELQLRRMAESRGWIVVAVYNDVMSGSRNDRPGLADLLRDAALNQFDVCAFWALDRLTRDGALTALSVLSQLTRAGVKWVSLQEPYLDSVHLGPFADVLVSLQATLAAMERQRLIERTKAGLDNARSKGKVLGRKPLEVDLDRVRELRAEGHAVRDLAKMMGIKSHAALWRIMKREGIL